MKKTPLTFGLISGAVSSLMMVATVPWEDTLGCDRGEFVGYTIIVLSLWLVFFGIRSYRDNTLDGQITFSKAFALGISITLISCVCYVVTWKVLYFNFLHRFMDKCSAYMAEKLKVSGTSPAAVQAQLQQLEKYKQLYDNPLSNAAMTFLEPFPIGLVITLISAALLKNKGAFTTITIAPASIPEPAPTRPVLSFSLFGFSQTEGGAIRGVLAAIPFGTRPPEPTAAVDRARLQHRRIAPVN
ncbi:MAG: DUF4199 domain-containing protein [Terriglobales bacterium]|jgi:hypothetical protein